MAKHIESDIQYMRAVAELFEEMGLGELSVRREFGDGEGKLALRIARHAPARSAPSEPALNAVEPLSPRPAVTVSTAPEPVAKSGDEITSPMVGTVYLGPEPGADPFVKPGDAVHKGDTLLIVEAMKTMNFIDSPRSGTVRQVLVDDGEPVEYGTPLVLLG